MLKSLDPRMNRLGLITDESQVVKNDLDQFETYEVFLQTRTGKAYEHAGIVHAPNEPMALLFAKEQYSRRFTCTGMWVIKTENIKLTEYTQGEADAYDTLASEESETNTQEDYSVFHLHKKGKQHVHAGDVQAYGYNHALMIAKDALDHPKQVMNLWVCRKTDLLITAEHDSIIWDTLPEKKYRDVTAYKAAEKIKAFKEEQAKTA